MAKKKGKEDLLLEILEEEAEFSIRIGGNKNGEGADFVISVGEDKDGKYADIYSRNPNVVLEEKGLTPQEWKSLEYERKFRERSECAKKFICPRIGSHAAFCSTSGFSQCPTYRELPEPDPEESVYVTILRRREEASKPKNPPRRYDDDESVEI